MEAPEGATDPTEGETELDESSRDPIEGATDPTEGSSDPTEGATEPSEGARESTEGDIDGACVPFTHLFLSPEQTYPGQQGHIAHLHLLHALLVRFRPLSMR